MWHSPPSKGKGKGKDRKNGEDKDAEEGKGYGDTEEGTRRWIPTICEFFSECPGLNDGSCRLKHWGEDHSEDLVAKGLAKFGFTQ